MKGALVDIQSYIPTIVVELKYATPDNFTKEIVYRDPTCYLRVETAFCLRKVQDDLALSGLGLKIWDGYRSMAAQRKFWELVPDERYVSHPSKGGRHTRGTAVDVTLIGPDGKQLPMPTDFDEFSERAGRDYMGASLEAIQNRKFLEEVMGKHGFIGLPTEWWHFDLKGWENFPPLEVEL